MFGMHARKGTPVCLSRANARKSTPAGLLTSLLRAFFSPPYPHPGNGGRLCPRRSRARWSSGKRCSAPRGMWRLVRTGTSVRPFWRYSHNTNTARLYFSLLFGGSNFLRVIEEFPRGAWYPHGHAASMCGHAVRAKKDSTSTLPTGDPDSVFRCLCAFSPAGIKASSLSSWTRRAGQRARCRMV